MQFGNPFAVRLNHAAVAKRERQDVAPSANPRPVPHTETAAQLLREQFPEPVWTVEGLLQQGSTHLLVGGPKVGKSLFALSLAVAVATGGRVLGKLAATQGDVLYLALEDGKRRLQSRVLRMLGGDMSVDVSRLHYWTEWAPLNDGGVEDIEAWLDTHPDCGLVIIDTLIKVRGNENMASQRLYDADYRGIAPLTKMAQARNVGMIVVHHTRKAESDDPMNDISSSTGLPAAVDGAFILKRKRKSADGSLYVLDRDMGDKEMKLYLDDQTGGWVLAGGDSDDEQMSSEREAIIGALLQFGTPQQPKDIAAAIEKPVNSVTVLMYRMLKDRQLYQPRYAFYDVTPTVRAERQTRDSYRNSAQSYRTLTASDAETERFYDQTCKTGKTGKTERESGDFAGKSSSFSGKTDGVLSKTSAFNGRTLTGLTGLTPDSEKYVDQVIAAVKSGGGRLFINSAGGLTLDPPRNPPAWLDAALAQLHAPLLEWLRANGGEA